MKQTEELQLAVVEYKKVMDNIQADIDRANVFLEDFNAKYKFVHTKSLNDGVTCATMVLRVQDYITQKRNDMVELKRQLVDIENAIENAKTEE